MKIFQQDEKNMAEEERNQAKQDLQKHEDELDRAQREHDAIKTKLIALERKIIVGGENLLEKAEEQVRCIFHDKHERNFRQRLFPFRL